MSQRIIRRASVTVAGQEPPGSSCRPNQKTVHPTQESEQRQTSNRTHATGDPKPKMTCLKGKQLVNGQCVHS